MAPKSHPRSGNRPKDHDVVTATKSPSNNKRPAPVNALPVAISRSNVHAHALPIELQQALLNVFAHAFPLAGDETELKATIQEVKGHLYRRDFATAFGRQEYLAAYAVRWSAARALAYADILTTLDPDFRWLLPAAQTGEEAKTPSRIVCIGGGAGSEAVALAAVMKHRRVFGLHIDAIDIADWAYCLQLLQDSITRPPPLSQYSSESARAANRSLLDQGQLLASFRPEDVLEYTQERLSDIMVGKKLITIMFTLNELFTSSVSKTTAFLLALTYVVEHGALLLVVDSAGSYAEVKLGKEVEAKQYPMTWLLDHTILELAGDGKWKKKVGEDSKWFRLESKLKYPIKLEDMRYQVHLYERSRSRVTDSKRPS